VHANVRCRFFTPFITKAINFKYGYVFAGCNLVAGLGVYLFVIEGQGRTIEEIDTMYLLGVKPWESAKWVMPDLDKVDPEIKQRLGTVSRDNGAPGGTSPHTTRVGDREVRNTSHPEKEEQV
jgi:hypothetical protein